MGLRFLRFVVCFGFFYIVSDQISIGEIKEEDLEEEFNALAQFATMLKDFVVPKLKKIDEEISELAYSQKTN